MELFDARIREWFAGRFDRPTDIQSRAWPHIARGEHVLLTAPTGSGKTLTAFLWAVNQLASGAWERGSVRVLYVSPLKALNNDIRRNLLEPLGEMGLDSIRVLTRSGDTPQATRRRMLREPPEILVTTPESLNLLLSSHGGRGILHGIKTVILDEIHAVAGNKRGVYLMTAVERLVELSGEFQRIALSATVRPLEVVARFVAGTRPVRVLESEDVKRLEVSVLALEETGWPRLVEEFREIVERNRSTLFFVNSRALSEKIVRWINEQEEEPVAYAHHGSLSREIRTLVERRLKQGSLKAIVATSSLELGIDIGQLDEVVLVQAPRSIHSAVQRVGRAGHAVGETSRGRIYPTHGRDFVDAAVLAPLVEQRACEELRCVRNPLDVLAQVIVAMCGIESRHPDELYRFFTRIWSFGTLRREAFDRVISMLCGRYQDTRIRELRPRLRIDPETGRAVGRKGALQLVWRSGGVIPDRGYFQIRVEGSGARLGELDEEFVWERRIGDHFTIGAQSWRIVRITKNDVEVAPSSGGQAMAPFWRAERFDRDYELCEQAGLFLERADGRLEDRALRAELRGRHKLSDQAADQLLALLRRQKQRTGAPLPHRHHMLIEHLAGERRQVIFHANWGGRVLRPLGLAMMVAARFLCETFVTDDCLLVQLPDDIAGGTLLDSISPDNVEALVRERLEQTGFFGVRFRENAMRALLLPRQRANLRMPLWLTRHRAKKLLQSVAGFCDFPIVAETWRTCLEDEFDLKNLRRMLDELRTGVIRTTEVRLASASPFAQGVSWHSTNQLMYDDDRPLGAGGPSLSEQALREVMGDAALRPRLNPELVAEFEAKLQRTAPGYGAESMLDLVEERMLVPDGGGELEPGLERMGPFLVASAMRARIERARRGEAGVLKECVAEFLLTHGPVTLDYLCDCWQAGPESMRAVLQELLEERRVVADRLRDGAGETEFCDTENLERLLRLTRAAARPSFEPLPKAALPLWLATVQGVARRGDSIEDLRARLETLFGYVAPAALWERAIFRARLRPYEPAWLESLLRQSDLIWFGGGKEQAGFCFLGDLPLFLPEAAKRPELFSDGWGSCGFFELQERSGLGSAELTDRLWELVWEGRVVNDSFMALRKGIETRFRPAAPAGRRGLRSWTSSRPLMGSWRAVDRPGPGDRLEQAQDDKERARMLLRRYGVLFGELCRQELGPLRWGRLLRALRILELSGEVLAGQFFKGIDGLQFASHEAFRRLRSGLEDQEAVYWLNAADPASLCGTGLLDDLPPRLPTTWLVYRGASLVMVARRNGRRVELAGWPKLRYLDLFGEMDARVEVERINGQEASASVHAPLFLSFGFVRDRKSLVLERSF